MGELCVIQNLVSLLVSKSFRCVLGVVWLVSRSSSWCHAGWSVSMAFPLSLLKESEKKASCQTQRCKYQLTQKSLADNSITFTIYSILITFKTFSLDNILCFRTQAMFSFGILQRNLLILVNKLIYAEWNFPLLSIGPVYFHFKDCWVAVLNCRIIFKKKHAAKRVKNYTSIRFQIKDWSTLSIYLKQWGR